MLYRIEINVAGEKAGGVFRNAELGHERKIECLYTTIYNLLFAGGRLTSSSILTRLACSPRKLAGDLDLGGSFVTIPLFIGDRASFIPPKSQGSKPVKHKILSIRVVRYG